MGNENFQKNPRSFKMYDDSILILSIVFWKKIIRGIKKHEIFFQQYWWTPFFLTLSLTLAIFDRFFFFSRRVSSVCRSIVIEEVIESVTAATFSLSLIADVKQYLNKYSSIFPVVYWIQLEFRIWSSLSLSLFFYIFDDVVSSWRLFNNISPIASPNLSSSFAVSSFLSLCCLMNIGYHKSIVFGKKKSIGCYSRMSSCISFKFNPM